MRPAMIRRAKMQDGRRLRFTAMWLAAFMLAAAKQSAAQAKNQSMKRAFEEISARYLMLAEQMEWIDRQRSTLRDEENDRSLC